MDATYKTTKYELALFFVAVKTNVGYTAVADFVLQSETAEQIAEALKILSSWNPKWQPPYFMIDYSEAEIEAIQGTFPVCKVYLCGFPREQARERCVRSMVCLLMMETPYSTFFEAWLKLLLPLTMTSPLTIIIAKTSTTYIMESTIWKDNSLVREWLQGKWLCSPQVNICRNIAKSVKIAESILYIHV